MKLENFNYTNYDDKKICEEFLNNPSKRFVLGRNKWAKSIISKIKVNGIIDDFTKEKYYEGLKIYKMQDIPKNAIVVSATMGRPQTAKRKLNKLNIKNVDYFAFYKYSNLEITPPPFINDFKEDFIKNRKQYEWVYNNLADEISKKVFEDIINFKITLDLNFLQNYYNDKNNQYFEIYKMPKNPVFIDGGGYIGDTTKIFINKFKDYKKIYLFEPVEKNMKLAKKNLKRHHNIEFVKAGISNYDGYANIIENGDSSYLSENGKKIKIYMLDNIINEKIDLIKLDLEGEEQNAIEGAKKIIKNYKPILAICIYHKAEDWYKIPKKIFNICNNYKIYLRHYSESISETVMYFIPQKEH